MKFLDRKNLNKVILGVITVVVTVIAVIGLIQAPSKSSDRLAQDLQQQFQENAELLKQQEEAKKASAEQEAIRQQITFVGDSVMLGAAPELLETIPGSVIDAKESRQVRDGVEILKELQSDKKLGGTVVIELGTNSYFNESTGQEIIDYLDKDTKIYWITVYGKYLQDQERTNQVIRNLAEHNESVKIIAWDAEAAKHPDWFYNDGIHLNGAGRSGFADLIRTSLGVEAPTTEE